MTLNICLIEDDPTIRKALSKVLEREGHFVAVCSNGREGLNIASSRRFDLVITDIIMPEVEGIEVIQKLRQHQPDLRIIAMSGGGRVGNTDFLEIAKSIGAHEVLYKPVTRTEVMQAIERCMAQ
ncbi:MULTISPECIES: response regulator [Kordiimonas]|jgi:CheY-like chemotaxis protein|uniref:response regulator n=1 Tax=Kordiimonas TaxID=288021 RepID=UPI00257F6DDB|nr:response regulator [Kordiimonas sp. UBA4487]